MNRQRTAHVVERLDLAVLQRVDRKRDEVSAIPDHAPGLRRAKKEAYFQVISSDVLLAFFYWVGSQAGLKGFLGRFVTVTVQNCLLFLFTLMLTQIFGEGNSI